LQSTSFQRQFQSSASCFLRCPAQRAIITASDDAIDVTAFAVPSQGFHAFGCWSSNNKFLQRHDGRVKTFKMIRRAIRFAPVGKNPCISWAHGSAHSLCKWPEMRWLHFRPRWLHFLGTIEGSPGAAPTTYTGPVNHGPGSGLTGIWPSKASCVWIPISSPGATSTAARKGKRRLPLPAKYAAAGISWWQSGIIYAAICAVAICRSTLVSCKPTGTRARSPS